MQNTVYFRYYDYQNFTQFLCKEPHLSGFSFLQLMPVN